jgi:hypothetical protein
MPIFSKVVENCRTTMRSPSATLFTSGAPSALERARSRLSKTGKSSFTVDSRPLRRESSFSRRERLRKLSKSAAVRSSCSRYFCASALATSRGSGAATTSGSAIASSPSAVPEEPVASAGVCPAVSVLSASSLIWSPT